MPSTPYRAEAVRNPVQQDAAGDCNGNDEQGGEALSDPMRADAATCNEMQTVGMGDTGLELVSPLKLDVFDSARGVILE